MLKFQRKGRMTVLLALGLSMSLLATACGGSGTPKSSVKPSAVTEETGTAAVKDPAKEAKLWIPVQMPGTYNGTLQPDQLSKDDIAGVSSIEQNMFPFTYQLLQKLPQNEDITLSPFSLVLALAGYSEALPAEAQQALYKQFNTDRYTFENENEFRTMVSKTLDLNLTGSPALEQGFLLLGAEKLKWNEAYLKNMHEAYAAQAVNVDYSQGPELQKQINSFVDQVTKGRIKNFLDKPLDSKSLLTLLQVITYNGAWNQPFDKASTKDGTFHGRDGDTTVPMMHSLQKEAGYADGEDMQVLHIPYEDGFEAVFLLPKEGHTPREALLRAFNPNVDLNYSIMSADLTLPRFNIEKTTDLLSQLPNMGLASWANALPLSSFESKPSSVMNLLKQTVRITTDEVGTKAEAVTAAGANESAPEPKGTIKLTLDRPFGFIILAGGIPMFVAEIQNVKP